MIHVYWWLNLYKLRSTQLAMVLQSVWIWAATGWVSRWEARHGHQGFCLALVLSVRIASGLNAGHCVNLPRLDLRWLTHFLFFCWARIWSVKWCPALKPEAIRTLAVPLQALNEVCMPISLRALQAEHTGAIDRFVSVHARQFHSWSKLTIGALTKGAACLAIGALTIGAVALEQLVAGALAIEAFVACFDFFHCKLLSPFTLSLDQLEGGFISSCLFAAVNHSTEPYSMLKRGNWMSSAPAETRISINFSLRDPMAMLTTLSRSTRKWLGSAAAPRSAWHVVSNLVIILGNTFPLCC